MFDPLESNIISLILAWVIALPIFMAVTFGTLSQIAELFTEREAGSPRWLPWFGIYYLFCLVIISPMRYIILQFLLIESYGVQSISAAINSLIMVTYFEFVLLALYIPSIGLPHLLMLTVSKNDSKATPIIAIILTPLAFAVGYALFFLLLPYACLTIHWLPDRDVIRSANGPATVFYKLAVEPDIPRIGPKLQIQNADTANKRLRSHILETYVSTFKRTKRHFGDSLRFIQQAIEVLNKQQGFIVTIPKSDLETILAAYKSSSKEAQQVDTNLLNEYVEGLGTIYRDKFIPGLQDLIKGIEDSDTKADLRGQLLLNQWGSWYNKNFDAIWDAL